MYCIFITGTAGSGKSLLTSRLVPWYGEKGSYAVSVNLDPGAQNLPYSPDVDIRNYVDLETVMESYQLGPNGALILASDLIATRIEQIQDDIDSFNPDYVIIDTPGQIELFAYRASGPFVVQNLRCDGRAVVFLFDSSLVSTAVNFVSVALLAASIQLRLKVTQIPVLSKKDLIGDAWKKIAAWCSNPHLLEDSIGKEAESIDYLLSRRVLHSLIKTGFAYELIPLSSITFEGFITLSGTLARVLSGGEEVED